MTLELLADDDDDDIRIAFINPCEVVPFGHCFLFCFCF